MRRARGELGQWEWIKEGKEEFCPQEKWKWNESVEYLKRKFGVPELLADGTAEDDAGSTQTRRWAARHLGKSFLNFSNTESNDEPCVWQLLVYTHFAFILLLGFWMAPPLSLLIQFNFNSFLTFLPHTVCFFFLNWLQRMGLFNSPTHCRRATKSSGLNQGFKPTRQTESIFELLLFCLLCEASFFQWLRLLFSWISC